jgi:hypothetical protein
MKTATAESKIGSQRDIIGTIEPPYNLLENVNYPSGIKIIKRIYYLKV